jgi:radical SAM superfamily enzyme YgiQ (UPF0313 family)
MQVPKILLVGSYDKRPIQPGQFQTPPMGVYRLKSWLKMQDISSEVFDPNLEGPEKLLSKVAENHYDIIGFSLIHPILKYQVPLLAECYRRSKNSLFIGGGLGAQFNSQQLLQKTPVKIVVKGFGELQLTQIARNFSSGVDMERFRSISGLVIKSEGQIIDTGHAEVSNQLFRDFSLAFDFSEVPYARYWELAAKEYSPEHLSIMGGVTKTIRLITTSHCPLKCIFCGSRRFLEDARGSLVPPLRLNAEDIVGLITKAIEAHPGTEAIYFSDDNFLMNDRRLIELNERMRLLRRKIFSGKQFKFFCLATPFYINAQVLTKLKNMNFTSIFLGVESFSDKILKDLRKISRSNISRIAMQKILNAGITPIMSIILFPPTITVEDLIQTIDGCVTFIKKGARVRVFDFIDVFPEASIMHSGYPIRNLSFKIFPEDEDNLFTIPYSAPPIDLRMEELALKAREQKKGIEDEIKKKYHWCYEDLPQPIDNLALFLAIYRLLNRSTEKIDALIDQIMKRENGNGSRRK